MPSLPVPDVHLGRSEAVTSIEAKKEWDSHLAGCEQCQLATKGVLRTKDDGTGWARSWEKRPDGRQMWGAWVNMLDKEYKNRT